MKRARGRPPADEAEGIHKRILEAATREFMAFGYERSSMRRIATAANSTRPTIYRLYPSKELLFKTIILKAIQENTGSIPELRQELRSPEIVLGEVAERIREVRSEGTLLSLWQVAVDIKEEFPDIYRDVREIIAQRTITKKLADYLEALDGRGELTVANPALAAQNFVLLVGPASEILDVVNEGDTEDERIKEVIQLFLRAYASRTSPK